MCSGVGAQPSITGFTFDAHGQLTPSPGSTRPLSRLPNSGCTQVAFNRTGNVVIVEEQVADVIATCIPATTTGPSVAQLRSRAPGEGPFGLIFTQRNQVLTTENFMATPLMGRLASYDIEDARGRSHR